MTPQDIQKHYKTAYRFYKETGMSQNSLANWFKWGYVPLNSQVKIERITEGVLKADFNHGRRA